MQIKVFTLGFNSLTESFDEKPLQEFIRDKEVLAVKEHFFERHDVPYLALVVSYKPSPVPVSAAKEKDGDWRELIAESEMPLFNSLRTWRNERAKKEGLAAYIICHNRQLADIIKLRPQSLAQLSKVDGFGEAKLKKYGRDILEYFKTAPPEEETPETASAEARTQ
jgi:ATP-dependent DNA helicase RecQ